MKKIILNKTLEQYKKRYKNKLNSLLKFSKKEVEDFDKANCKYIHNNVVKETGDKNLLLYKHKWWLIGDAYYEAPLTTAEKWIIGGVIGAIALGILGFSAHEIYHKVYLKNLPINIDVSQKVKENIDIKEGETKPEVGKSYTYTFDVKQESIDKGVRLPGKIDKVTTGGVEVPEKESATTFKTSNGISNEQDNYYTYTCKNENTEAELFIKKILGPVQVSFTTTEKTEETVLTGFTVPEEKIYIVGEKINFGDFKVGYKLTDGSIAYTQDYKITVENNHEFTKEDVKDDIEVKLTLKDKDLITPFKIDVVDNAVRVTNNEDLMSKLSERKYTTFILNEGEYHITEGYGQGFNDLRFYGKNAENTIYYVGEKDDYYGQANGDFQLTGSNAYFKNVKFIDNKTNPTAFYTGFADAGNLKFNNCHFTSDFWFWGIGDVEFNNCKFTDKDPDSNQYIFVPYSGKSFVFNDCSFDCNGKCFNVYREDYTLNPYKMTLNRCNLKSSKQNKVAFNIKDVLSNGCGVLLTLNDVTYTNFGTNKSDEEVQQSDVQGTLCYCTNHETNSSTVVTYNDKVAWQNGKKTDLIVP